MWIDRIRPLPAVSKPESNAGPRAQPSPCSALPSTNQTKLSSLPVTHGKRSSRLAQLTVPSLPFLRVMETKPARGHMSAALALNAAQRNLPAAMESLVPGSPEKIPVRPTHDSVHTISAIKCLQRESEQMKANARTPKLLPQPHKMLLEKSFSLANLACLRPASVARSVHRMRATDVG